MKLVYTDNRYVLVCSYQERQIPKSAGFRWDPATKEWYTTDSAVAVKFAEIADGSVPSAEIQRVQETIEWSRATDANVTIPAASGCDYMPFQKAGVLYACGRSNTLFADEMGLGKTIQAIGVVNWDPGIRKVLVVCQAIKKIDWRDEFEKWLARPMQVRIISAASLSFPKHPGVVIINYDILTKFRRQIMAHEWDALIVDECHYVKNPSAQRSKNVYTISAKRKLFLTGTPIVNRPYELWPILHALDPQRWQKPWPFYMRYCAAKQGAYGWDFKGASNLEELQARLRATIMVRRLKSEVLKELPPKVRQIIQLPPVAAIIRAEKSAQDAWRELEKALEQAVEEAEALKDDEAFAEAVRALQTSHFNEFSNLSKIRHETALAKVPYVIDHIKETMGAVEKLVVFAHHKDVLSAIRDALPEFPSVLITGETPMQKRADYIKAFQQDEKVRVFYGTIGATGTGITLTAASTVLFVELDWVPGNVTQAEDRCHRIGQTDSVLVQHLVIEGSLDAHIAKTIVDKQSAIDRALNAR